MRSSEDFELNHERAARVHAIVSMTPDFPRAITAFTKAIELRPWSAEAFLHRGAAKYRCNSRDSVDDLIKSLALQPDNNSDAHWIMANFFTRSDTTFDEAKRHFGLAAKDALPNSIEALRSEALLQEDMEGLEKMNQVVARAPFDPMNYLDRAYLIQEVFEKRNVPAEERTLLHSQAITDIDTAHTALPKNPTSQTLLCRRLLERASFLRENGELEDAAKAIDRLKGLAESAESGAFAAIAYVHLSLFHKHHGDAATAKAEISKAVQLDPYVDLTPGDSVTSSFRDRLGRQ